MALSIDSHFKKKPFNFLFYIASIPSTPSTQLCTLARFRTHCFHGNLVSGHHKVLVLKNFTPFFPHNLAGSRY